MGLIVITGRITEPEKHYTSEGKLVLSFSIPDNRWKKTDAGGEQVTTWWKIALFGDAATRMEERLEKGTIVMASGKPDLGQWKDKDGNLRFSPEILYANIDIVEKPRASEARAPRAQGEPAQRLPDPWE